MNCMELKFARQRKHRTQKDMADVIRKSLNSYSLKERGEVAFSPDEIVMVSLSLGLTAEQINDIFFDGNLPFRKCNCAVTSPTA
ncbi:MAG: helix-turn-helix transcriptional regulator [Thermincola sp.]|jgi:transcriptional regulator with XRE-family HTH domain|nr:helix-turn-helix transcriptional regulator [Thermincola sp.]MDT3702681.1 helix-turn-helix transcriptional regulator [Thermincola sp.]